MIDVFYNGKFAGEVEMENAKSFVESLKERRRIGEFPIEMSFRFDEDRESIFITTETGRVLRPLIVVKDGRSTCTPEHLKQVAEGKLSWNDIVKQGIIEYIDAAEEENSFIALNENNIAQEHTHLEIDPVGMMGFVTSIAPFANHDSASRLIRGSKTQKQSLGLYAANYLCRLDTDVSILHYPQRPVARSFVYDSINFYPAGQNMVVAILPYEGYNMEDAIIMNKASVERGLGRSSYFRPYTTVELHYAGGLSDEICIPTKDVSGYRTEKTYRFLEDDGIVYPEAKLSGNDVVVGKTSPPKFLSEMGEISIKARKENSSTIRQEEQGTIDDVFITIDTEGNKIIQVRTRDTRFPELGDKYSTSHGQKGVIGAIVPEDDLPFTSSGIRPDILFNPQSIPSRMTVGYLIELLAGKIGCLNGKVVDATPFTKLKIEDLEKELLELGFSPDGKETLYHGITGKPLEAKIYVGNMYYLKLKYMVANKIHARASGKVTLLTRQPVEGRSKGGALRLGEMEQQTFVAHGSSLLLKERFDSDKVVLLICDECGSIAIRDKIHKRNICPICSQNSKLHAIEVSYAFKLLIEELMSLHIFPHLILKDKFAQN